MIYFIHKQMFTEYEIINGLIEMIWEDQWKYVQHWGLTAPLATYPQLFDVLFQMGFFRQS